MQHSTLEKHYLGGTHPCPLSPAKQILFGPHTLETWESLLFNSLLLRLPIQSNLASNLALSWPNVLGKQREILTKLRLPRSDEKNPVWKEEQNPMGKKKNQAIEQVDLRSSSYNNNMLFTIVLAGLVRTIQQSKAKEERPLNTPY